LRRGEIWWARLAPPTGSGPGYRRPVLIVQSDEFNRSKIRTVVVAVITSNPSLAAAPGNVSIPRGTGGLTRRSIVNVSQLLTIDRSLLTEHIGNLPADRMISVDMGLLLVLGIGTSQ
jgi:mRNA interferase MazF